MKNVKLVRRKQRLDSLFTRVKSQTSDPEMMAHWARYLCILVSGFIEFSVKTILADYAEGCSHPRIANFIESELGYFQNPKTEKILELIGKFDAAWRENIESSLDERLKAAINSVVGNRNQIAHGNDVGLSFVSLSNYYTDVVKAIDLIESVCV